MARAKCVRLLTQVVKQWSDAAHLANMAPLITLG